MFRPLFVCRFSPAARRGNVLILTALMMIVMMALLAVSVDTGYMYTLNTQLKRQVDAAALAGAGELVNGLDVAEQKVVEYLVRNPVGKQNLVGHDEELEQYMAAFLAAHQNDYEIRTGHWDPVAKQVVPAETGLPSTLCVTMRYPNNPLFFAQAIGHKDFDIQASAIAQFQPRDIQMVLDFSGSMNDDSTFAKISHFGRTEIEANLQGCWADLGNPTYGNVLTFEPKWAVVQGVPQNNSNGTPHLTVEYRYNSVYITSTHNISKVKLEFSNGNTRTINTSGTTGTYQGSGSDASKQIVKVWIRSWNNNNAFGSNGEYFNFTSGNMNTVLKTALGLNSVAWPYPSGSWNDYIDYCESSSSQNNSAGYRYKFGYLSLMNYWLDQRDSYAETPDLWKVRAQPVTSLKDSVDVFMDYLRELPTGDRVGFSLYNSNSGYGTLESGLTDDLDSIANLVRLRQAGHYTPYTAIGAGMKNGREHLVANARPGAVKLMVLMTDGIANYYNGQMNESGARAQVLEEANFAKAAGFKIMTISLGSGADTGLMQQVADITDGEHFNVPGGTTVDAYREQLLVVFRKIANARPLKLVQ
jgi:hypothetical protein